MDLSTLLKEAGPYTAPLCVAMMIAGRWFLKDRERLLKALSDSSARERRCADLRGTEGIECGKLMAESNQSLRDHDRVLERLIERINHRWG